MIRFVIDTSAIVAVLSGEPEAPSFNALLSTADDVLISTGTLHEANCVVSSSRFVDGVDRLRQLVLTIQPKLVAFDRMQAEIARDAYGRYGRGSGHRARLNMGDCFAYALAKQQNLPLFKGDDFAQTDIPSAQSPA